LSRTIGWLYFVMRRRAPPPDIFHVLLRDCSNAELDTLPTAMTTHEVPDWF